MGYRSEIVTDPALWHEARDELTAVLLASTALNYRGGIAENPCEA